MKGLLQRRSNVFYASIAKREIWLQPCTDKTALPGWAQPCPASRSRIVATNTCFWIVQLLDQAAQLISRSACVRDNLERYNQICLMMMAAYRQTCI